MDYVLDSSFVVAYIVPDEKSPSVDKLFTKIKNADEKYVPQLFWYEISNIYRNLILRKRYSFEDVMRFYVPLEGIRLTIDYETGVNYSRKLLRLCNEYSLSSYDAAYLELAERKNACLCTLDKDLQLAAKKYGVNTIK